MSTYTALGSIAPPGSLVFGYHRGDRVEEGVVENWHLVVGEDVVEGELPTEELPTTVPVARPSEDATRADWEAYAVANGMEPEKAAEVAQEDLEAVEPVEPETVEVPVETAPTDRPAESANKAEWIAYVTANGSDADRMWAKADGTTKANLIAWEPAGDPVAVAAGEQAND